MADRTVKVVFVGDASSLKRATDQVGSSLAKVQTQVANSSNGFTGVFSKLGSQAKTATDGVSGHFSRMASSVGHSMATFGKVVGAGVLAGAAGLAVFGKGAVSAASGLAESLGKSNVVFGEQAAEIEKWAGTASRAFGQSKQQALEAAGTYGNLFQAFGVGRTESAKMSKSLVELAADLASFNNTSVDDALEALRSGLSGETEPLKKFGVALSDERLKIEAVRLGLIKSVKDGLTPAAKAQASYALIMKDTALAQGDFARTSDGLANRTRILKARFADIQAEIGTKLLPVMVGLAGFILDKVLPAFETLSRKLGPVFNRIGGFVSQFSRSFAASDFPHQTDKWANAAIRLAQVFRTVFDGIGKFTSQFFRSFAASDFPHSTDKLANAAIRFAQVARAAFDGIKASFTALLTGFTSGGGDIENSGFAGFLERIGQLARTVFEYIKTNGPPAVAAIGKVFQEEVLPRVQSFFNWVTTKLIPALIKAGGVIKKEFLPALRDDILPALQQITKVIVDVILPAVGKMSEVFLTKILPVLVKAQRASLSMSIAFVKAVIAVVGFGKQAYDALKPVAAVVISVGKAIVDVVGKIIEFGKKMLDVGKDVIGAVSAVIAKFAEVAATVGAKVAEIVGFFTGIAGRIADGAGDVFGFIIGAITTAKDWVGDRVDEIVGFVGGIGNRIGGFASDLFYDVKFAIVIAKNFVSDKVDDIVGFFKGLGQKIKDAVVGVYNFIIEPFERAFNFIMEKWNSGPGKIFDKLDGLSPFGGGVSGPTGGAGAAGGAAAVGMRALGGPVLKGMPYIVGEKRPELFVPNVNGTIVPDLSMLKSGQLRQPQLVGARGGSSGSGSRTVVVHINAPVYGVNDLKRTIKEAVIKGSKADGGWNVSLRNAS